MPPAKECDNGKWKWGTYGDCKYNSKAEAEADNEDYRALEDIDLDVNEGMIEEAKKGLEWRKEFGRGGTEVGVKTANMIINNTMTIERVKKMYAYFKRHEPYQDSEGFEVGEEGYPSNSRIAHALWGGDSGYSWSEKKRNQIMKEENRTIVGTLITDGIELPLYTTKEEAEAYAEEMGGNGSHPHSIDGSEYFMPFNTHAEALEFMSTEEVEENTRSIDKCKECEDNCEDECIKNNKPIGEQKIKYIWDKKYNNITMEKRIYNIETRVQEGENEKMTVIGHASLYNSRSEDLGGFYEYIQEGAFTDELIAKSDVRALINHDPNLILARNTAGTLKLTADNKGLRYEFDIPNTSYGKDLAENLRNGNISQSSFAFTVGADEWTTDNEGRDIRTITKIDRLYDISSVTYPAYALAESELLVAKRGLHSYKEKKELEKEEEFLVKRSLAKLKIEIAKRK